MLIEKLDSLSADEKRAALAKMLRARADGTHDYPLSSSQLSIWLQQQMEPDSAVYNIPLVFLIEDEVEPAMLERCLEEVVSRHKVLRNTFEDGGDQPQQRLSDWRLPPLATTDLRHLPANKWREEALRCSAEQARDAIDLRTGPLLRVELLRFSPRRYVLLITVHHIVFDGWSVGVLVGEITALYVAMRNGKTSPLPDLSVNFEDFVRWERAKLSTVKLTSQIEYWRQRLDGAPTALELPADYPRPASQTYRGSNCSFTVPGELARALKTTGQRACATFFMTTLAAFYVWLHRLSGQDDLVLGVAVANRERREFWSLLGSFANTVPMRAVMRGKESFLTFLDRVKSEALADYAHVDVPIMKLVEELNPQRFPGRSALFQAGFDLQNSPWPSDVVGSNIALVDGETGAAKLDLNLSLSELGDGKLVGYLEYRTDLFDEFTIRGYLDAFCQLLASIVANPKGSIGELDLLGTEQRRSMLHAWNDTACTFPAAPTTLLELFARGASRAPEAPAVCQEEVRWSYAELDARANWLAHRLRKAGVGFDCRVGLHSERAPSQLAALLGILKVGGAYVPLDAGLPLDRLAFIAEDAGLTVVLTSRLQRSKWPGARYEVLCIEDELKGFSITEPPACIVQPLHLAYVIYTSGSTGRPKGVMVPHGAVVNHALAAGQEFALESVDRVLQFASLSFDASAEEIFPCWFHGAELVLRSDDMISTPRAFMEACYRAEISVVDLPTAYWHELVAALAVDDIALPSKLRLVIIGGEQAASEAVKTWQRCAKARVRLLNTYGPTEATIVATSCDLSIPDSEDSAQRSVSIGRPIANVSAFLVDGLLVPVPLGVHGEILLGGAGVARGYLNRPDLTALKFIPNPFGNEPGGRLYCTGDMGRRLSSGAIEFVGRGDDQVKIRGFRVELGEIESILRQHPAVQEVLVTIREASAAQRRIIAYVACSTRSVTTAELREWLGQRLPEYMIPSTLLILDALPRNASGKVDRQALNALAPATVDLGRIMTAPRTPSEEVMAGIWCEVLGLEQVGVYDNFFELGGHSLVATQVLSRVRRVMHVEVPLHAFFEAPTIARFVQLIEADRWSTQGIAPPPIEHLPRKPGAEDRGFTQSFAQQRLWFLEQLEPGSAAYNIPSAVRLSGALDLGALQASLNEIVRRHEALRTVFRQENDQPIQHVFGHLEVSVPLIDLSAHETKDLEVRRLIDEEAHRPFQDLAHGPLLRMVIVRLDLREHVLLFTMHHIVSDAWSMGVIVQELAVLYRAYHAGEPSPLDDLKLQYADFAHWQRDWLSGERLEQQLGYWQERLRDAPAFLELPTDRLRAPTRSLAGASRLIELDRAEMDAIKQRSRVENVTPFMLLLAAFKALLFRLTGQSDIVVGTAIANRHREELEPLIGFFVNTLVLRTDLSGEPSFRELLRRVRETALGAYAHQDLPFEKLVEHLGPDRRWSGTPLFRVMFVLQNAPMPPLELPGVTMVPLTIENHTTKFDLTLEIVERPQGFVVIAQYSADLFEEETIERLLTHYRILLEGAVKAPEAPVSRLAWLSEEQRATLLRASEGQEVTTPALGATLHERFAAQARATPQALAVVGGDQSVSYGELEARANRLAHYLRTCGVSSESCVGVCIERSVSFVQSVLAVLKAGAAYVPLDPSYPLERLEYMLRDSGITVLLSDSAVLQKSGLASHEGLKVVRLDEDRDVIAAHSDIAAAVPVDPEQLAYVIYTSGSSGQPKGVGCTHRGVVNLLEHMASLAVLPAAARCSAWTSLSFDVSVYEVLSPLLAGGCLVWVPEALRLDGSGFCRWLSEQKIESAYVPPFMLKDLQQWAEQGEALHLKRLLVGVEPIEASLLVSLQERVPGLEILNGYGPTEASICATLQPVKELVGTEVGRGSPTPIGRAVANMRAYVLDEQGEPLPVGVGGELYLGGAGLARGYWGRADQTAESFVPDAWSGRRGERLYRTGDRVRYLANGRLEFLGRVDQQVKVRGYRIEPGEIESALLAQGGVKRAVVLAREDVPGDKRLVAYVEHEAQATPNAADLREALKQHLPEFMLPSAFVFLPALPQTAHGKVDRHALPAPERAERGQNYVEPRTPLEAALCRIWGEVLQREQVGIEENFFELGGHSLLATQVISRVRKALRMEVPLHSLFEEPTIAGLARGIEAKRWGDRALLAPPLQAGERSEEVEQKFGQSFAQQRLWFLEQLEPGSSTYNIPSAVRLRGELDLSALQASVQGLIERHESLRSRFALTDEGLVQIVARSQALTIGVTNLESLAEAEREERMRDLILEESQRGFDLAQGPLMRVTVLRLEPLEHVVLLTIHHIISDGWSMGVLVRELGSLYNAHCAGSTPSLPPLPIGASDFFRRQQDWLAQGALEQQLSYWRERLVGAPPLLELPTDRPRTKEQSAQGATAFVVLPPALAERARGLGRQEGATLYMALLAAFNVLLSRYGDQKDIVIGTPIANRQFEEVESLIGHLTNAVALRTDLSGDPSFRQLLQRVRDTSLGAYAHQDLPFEKLVEQLGPERRWSRTPVFQVMFVLQNTPQPPLELSGLAATPVTVPNTTTMFDLTLEVVEHSYGLVTAFQYSTDLFDQSTIERMLGHFRRLLEGAIDAPDTALSRLPLLSQEEYEQVIVEWNAARDAPLSSEQLLHHVFEQQAVRTPDAVAVVASNESVSYAELDARANRLAHHLRAQGVGPESRVGICLSRSPRMIESALAVLKAGAAYVPLDPAYPAGRLRCLIGDSAISALLCEEALLGDLEALRSLSDSKGRQVAYVLLDQHSAAIAARPSSAPLVRMDPENLAYVIYTSGSTGRSKGVMIEHRSAAAFVHACHELFSAEELADVLASTSLCFDLSTFEIFAPLSCGGRVHLVANAFETSADHAVSLINTVPSIMTDLLRFQQVPRSLRTINLAGEALALSLVRTLRDRLPDARIVNLYGPSEDTTYTTYFDIPPEIVRAPFIGRPVCGTQAYVLGPELQALPVGIVGEIYLGGAGLARGYWQRPDLTADAFMPDPYGQRAGSRLYRTGDRGRLHADGNIEYLGRNDYQIKMHGCRIELGEVESVLQEQPDVARAVVTLREDKAGEPRLVAYVVLRPQSWTTQFELLAWLRARMPEYMVPGVVVVLDALPTSTNGKIDRKALPAPDAVQVKPQRAFAPPETSAEQVLAEIWSTFLEVDRIGMHDSFFELGGHSLLATQILSRVRRVLQVDVPLRKFFEAPTLSGVLQTVAERAGGREVVEAIAKTYQRVMGLSGSTVKELLSQQET